jgi:hypothetical protein
VFYRYAVEHFYLTNKTKPMNLNFFKKRVEKLSAPKTAVQEFAKYVIEHQNEWLDYRLFANLYYDLNAHKKLAVMKENGFVFEERNMPFVSRYGMSRHFKQFRLVSDKEESIERYNKFVKVLEE